MPFSSWKTHYKSLLSQVQGAPNPKIPLSPLGMAIDTGAIDQLTHLAWAQEEYKLTCIRPEYFSQQSPSLELWNKLKSKYNWRADCLPLAEWEGVVFIGCLVPEEITPNFPHLFVLSPLPALKNLWNAYSAAQNNTKNNVQSSNELILDLPDLVDSPVVDSSPTKESMEGLENLKFNEVKSENKEAGSSESSEDILQLSDEDSSLQENSNSNNETSESDEGLLSFEEVSSPPSLSKMGDNVVLQRQEPATLEPSLEISPPISNEISLSFETPETESENVNQNLQANIPTAAIEVDLHTNPAIKKPVPEKQVKPIENSIKNQTVKPVTTLSLDENLNLDQKLKPPIKSLDTNITQTPPPISSIKLSSPKITNEGLKNTNKFTDKPVQTNINTDGPKAKPKSSVPLVSQADLFFLKDLNQGHAETANMLHQVLAELKSHYSKYMVLAVNSREDKALPLIWSQEFERQSTQEINPLSLVSPSIFYITAATQKAFHGYITPNELNDSFFEEWNQGQIPDHVTITPVVFRDSLIGMILSVGDKSANSFSTLRFAEKVAANLVKKISDYDTKALTA